MASTWQFELVNSKADFVDNDTQACQNALPAGRIPDWKKNGRSQTPADLSRHKFLLYTLADKPYEFRLCKNNVEEAVPVRPLLSANDGQIIRAAALVGLGILGSTDLYHL